MAWQICLFVDVLCKKDEMVGGEGVGSCREVKGWRGRRRGRGRG